MPTATNAFLAELGLQSSGPRAHQWGDDPGSEIWRASLTHPVLQRMPAKAEQPCFPLVAWSVVYLYVWAEAA